MVDTAERNRQIRQRLPLAERVEVARERENLALDTDLIAFINENSSAGGWFRSPGDAVETALGRLRNERSFIEEQCRTRGVTFKAATFYGLYKAELQTLAPAAVGRPRRNEVREVRRALVGATVAVELVAWANDTWLKEKAVERLSQVAEVGLWRLQAGGHRVDSEAEEPKLSVKPDALWKMYAAAAQVP